MSRIQVIEKEVFTFDELSDEAKEKALDKYRDFNVDHDSWVDGVYDQQTEIIKEAGFDITRIYYSGFWSQGDGAMFEYDGISDKLKDEYIDSLTYLPPMRKNWLRKWVSVSGNGKHRWHYYHENCCLHDISFELEFDSNKNDIWPDNIENFIEVQFEGFEDFVIENYRSLAQDLYSALEKEYEYLTNDESVKESLLANEYEFDKYGNIASY